MQYSSPHLPILGHKYEGGSQYDLIKIKQYLIGKELIYRKFPKPWHDLAMESIAYLSTRGGSREGGGTSKLHKEGKKCCVCAREHILVVNSYPDPFPPFQNPVSSTTRYRIDRYMPHHKHVQTLLRGAARAFHRPMWRCKHPSR